MRNNPGNDGPDANLPVLATFPAASIATPMMDAMVDQLWSTIARLERLNIKDVAIDHRALNASGHGFAA